MKRILLNSLLAFGLLSAQIACASGETNPSNEELNILTRRCSALGKQNGHNYEVVRGSVVKSWRYGSDVDCATQECIARNSWVATGTQLRLIESPSYEAPSVIYTPKENAEVLKEPYMKENRNYAFCARELKDKQSNSGEKYFMVDEVSTIKEIE